MKNNISISSSNPFHPHMLGRKQLEGMVKKNARELDEMDLSDHNGEYAVYNNGELFFSDSFDEGIKLGEKEFGVDSGFVVREIGKDIVMSDLVRA
jgi:hypothetical protein